MSPVHLPAVAAAASTSVHGSGRLDNEHWSGQNHRDDREPLGDLGESFDRPNRSRLTLPECLPAPTHDQDFAGTAEQCVQHSLGRQGSDRCPLAGRGRPACHLHGWRGNRQPQGTTDFEQHRIDQARVRCRHEDRRPTNLHRQRCSVPSPSEGLRRRSGHASGREMSSASRFRAPLYHNPMDRALPGRHDFDHHRSDRILKPEGRSSSPGFDGRHPPGRPGRTWGLLQSSRAGQSKVAGSLQTSASTVPSRRLRTQPSSSIILASRKTKARKPTPWTRPWIRSRWASISQSPGISPSGWEWRLPRCWTSQNPPTSRTTNAMDSQLNWV